MKFIYRFIVRVLVVLTLALFLALTYMHVIGVPKKLANYLLAEASTPNLAIEADSVRVDIFRGIIAEPVRIYQKHVVSSPFIHAEAVQIRFSPLAIFQKEQPVRHVRIIGLKLKSALQKNVLRKQNDNDVNNKNIKFKLEIVDSYWRNICIKSFVGEMEVSDDSWDVHDISITMSDSNTTGQAWGRIGYNETEKLLTGVVKTKLDPNILVPVLKAVNMKFLPVLFQRFEVGEVMPYCFGTFSKKLYKGGPLIVNAHVEFEEGKYRGVYLSKAETELNIVAEAGKKAIVTLDPLVASRDAGTANLKLVVDTVNQKVSFDGLLKDVNPENICGYIGILTNGFFNIIKMDSPLTATALGAFDYGHRSKTDFDIHIKTKRIYADKIYAENASLSICGRGETNYIENLKGDIYTGELTGGGYVFTGSDNTNSYPAGYKFKVDIKNAKLENMMQPLSKSKYSNLSGLMSGNVEVYGPLEKDFLNTMKGTGHIGIDKGEVFSLPIFGELSKFMKKIIPGLDFVMRQSDAKLDFVIAENKLHTDKLHIDGGVLSLSGDGDYYFNKDLDFDVRVKLLKSHTFAAKVMGIITYPISKLFEFQVSGTLHDPEWKPINFSTELLKRIGIKKDD